MCLKKSIAGGNMKAPKSKGKKLSKEEIDQVSGGAEGGGRNSRNSVSGSGRSRRQFAGGRGGLGK